jgi:hypothetical protein
VHSWKWNSLLRASRYPWITHPATTGSMDLLCVSSLPHSAKYCSGQPRLSPHTCTLDTVLPCYISQFCIMNSSTTVRFLSAYILCLACFLSCYVEWTVLFSRTKAYITSLIDSTSPAATSRLLAASYQRVLRPHATDHNAKQPWEKHSQALISATPECLPSSA